MTFNTGDSVRVKQRGTARIGGITMTDCTFDGVTIVTRNPDGSYQVRGIIKTPSSDETTVPADWIEAV